MVLKGFLNGNALLRLSLDGVKPLTVTMPYPILLENCKATLHRKDGVVVIVAAKAINDIWPEDIIRDQFRWNADTLQPWTDMKLIENHLKSQLQVEDMLNPSATLQSTNTLTRVRTLISTLFDAVMKKKQLFLQVRLEGSPRTEWVIRAHFPFRTSPHGAPLLLLTALDQRQIDLGQAKGAKQLSKKEFNQIFYGPPKMVHLKTAGELELLRYILRLNSVKIEPTAWQKEHLPQGGDSPWLATFIRPLYLDGSLFDPDVVPAGFCRNCATRGDNLKRCARCKIVAYCSVECQRAHWPTHKLNSRSRKY